MNTIEEHEPKPAVTVPATFTHGSIMRHVLVMTLTGAIGLISIFVVDFLSLLYVSWLRDPSLVAGVGYATQVLFFMTSLGIGLTIAVTALVARAVGRGSREEANRLAGSCLAHVAILATAVAIVMFLFRKNLLTLLGATGASFVAAEQFLSITIPGNTLLALGMSLAGILRAHGDPRRAMYVTLFGGIGTAIFDPLLIFGLHLGLTGAALATLLGRAIFVITGLWGALRVHKLIAAPRWKYVLDDLPAMLSIAAPAILTNLAAPVGNGYAMRVFSSFGESTMAAFVIIDRITPVAFGVLFALTGSVGPIIGQNVGAKFFGRVRRTLVDCFLMSTCYSLVMWLLLFLFASHIADIFAATGRTRDIVVFFCTFGVAAWLFLGCLFVANAAFNNLGYPLFATTFNWGRATLGTIPFVTLGAQLDGPEGGYMGIMFGAAAFGLAATATAFVVVRRLALRRR
jgi:putative MATE family efflux protein